MSTAILFDLQKFEKFVSENQEKYLNAQPFAHTVIDNFLDEEVAEGILKEFDLRGKEAIYYHHFNEKKQGFNKFESMGPVTRQVIVELNSGSFLKLLSDLTGVDHLINDPSLDGGGLHEMNRGGFLNVHVDFQSHTVQKNWSRRANLLIFFNKDWEDSYNGCLELWDKDVKKCVQKIKPVFNRCVIFNTTNISYHGVPEIIQCPEDRSRKSMALYYFKDEGKVCRLKPTNYRPRPEDDMGKRTAIYVDRSLVWAYSFVKRHCRFSEEKMSQILKKFLK